MTRQDVVQTTVAALAIAALGLWPLALKLDGGAVATPRATFVSVLPPADVVASAAPLTRASRSTRSASPAFAATGPTLTATPLNAPRTAADAGSASATPSVSGTATRSALTSASPAKDRPLTSGGRSLGIRDITEYCWTGNRTSSDTWPQFGDVAVLDRSIPFGTVVHIDGRGTFVVRDWIGHGSEFDIYAGRGADCETRASNFGRQHRAVTVQP